ncbi:MAG: type II secretion system F family protein [Holosporaceae bacterium]|jgi:type II secretory pathway component PulF|nr:type II secretion system F family protein [Holosporaceae bacterium]
MAIYKYKALTKEGFKKDGSILANDYRQAYDLLHEKQYQPMHIRKIYFASRKVNLEDLLMFFMHMNFQLKCKVGINDAIESFIDFHGNKVLNASLLDIVNAIKDGENIGDAFEKCNGIFDDTIIGLLRSAEKTGKTSDVISNILSFLKLQTDWKNNVKRIIAYPIFIALIAVLILILSVGILGPQVVSLVQDFGNGDIPILTKITIELIPQISRIIGYFLPTIFITTLILLSTKDSRKFLSNMLFKIPKIGLLTIKISLWQFCKILHIALSAKLDFIQALNLAIETIKFESIKDELKNIQSHITDGYKISDSFSKSQIIPSGIIMALYIGEEGNDLAASFNHISETQYEEILFDIKSLGQFLSIGLTLFTGLVLIFILCSLFYPIYNYIEIVGV